MKTKYILLSILSTILFISTLKAQKDSAIYISFKKDTIHLQEKFQYKKDKCSEVFYLEVIIDSIVGNINKQDLLVNYTSKEISAIIGKDYELLEDRILIPESEMKSDKTLKIPVTIVCDSLMKEGNEFFKITLKSENKLMKFNKGSIYVVIKDSERNFERENPFRINLGTNFDFIDGIKANTIYANLGFFEMNLITLKNRKAKNGAETFHSFGLYGGVYQNKYLTGDTIFSTRSSDHFKSYNIDSTYTINEIINKTASVTSTKNLGISFSPTFKFRTWKTGFTLLCNFEIEGVSQEITTTINTTRLDTITRTISESDYQNFKYRTIDNDSVYRSNRFYVGAGFPMLYVSQYGDMFLKLSTGLYWKKDPTENDFKPVVYTYYLIQFNIMEKHGFNLGGEIRGLYGKPQHYVGLYLSKAFNLDKFLQYK